MDSSIPKITVVTPSYNQGQFIEATVRSVLLQDYPNLEYVVMDGGSSDETVSILEAYDDRIDYWQSAPDGGQTHAINEGLRRASGEILGWLNSDDFLLPGALSHVAECFTSAPSTDLLSGAGISYDQETGRYQPHRACGTGWAPNLLSMLTQHGNVIQHSTFWRSSVLDQVGLLDESYDYAMDHEFFLRCCAQGQTFRVTDRCLAAFRRHKDQKTQEDGSPYVQEAERCKEPYESTGLLTSKPVQSVYERFFGFYKRHRNTHPSLGLVPTCNGTAIDAWLERIGVGPREG